MNVRTPIRWFLPMPRQTGEAYVGTFPCCLLSLAEADRRDALLDAARRRSLTKSERTSLRDLLRRSPS